MTLCRRFIMPPLAKPPKICLSRPRVFRMMVEVSATPGFVISFFRYPRVDALGLVRKPSFEIVDGQYRIGATRID